MVSVMDSFNHGKPARRPPQIDGHAFVYAAVAAMAVVVVFAYMHFVRRSGTSIASDQATVVNQANVAADAQAKATAKEAQSAAAASYAEAGSFADVGPDQLALMDPSVTYTVDPSTGPTIVSVASTPAAWGAAVESSSGTCFYVTISAIAQAHYGSGSPCTGQAALEATGHSW